MGCGRGAGRALGRCGPALAPRCRGLPGVEGHIEFHDDGWACTGCDFARPVPEAELVFAPDGAAKAAWADGRTHPVRLLLPGRFNQANALMAAVAADACGVDAVAALEAMESVEQVAGRFTVRSFGEVRARLMLAKNPAGWDELLDLVARSDAPLVVSIDAGWPTAPIPAGCGTCPTSGSPGDPSWRRETATGISRSACATRAWPTRRSRTRSTPCARPAGATGGVVDVIGNYTAFHDLLGAPG